MKTSELSENVFSRILRYKTTQFKTPFNVQFVSRANEPKNILVSDGRRIKSLTLSSKYAYLFDLELINPFDIITIYEVKRVGRFDLFVDNLKINEKYQIGNQKIGHPVVFNV